MQYCIDPNRSTRRRCMPKARKKTDEISIRAELLKARREERGWTQGELAYHAKVDQSQISKIESGSLPGVRFVTVARLAAALGTSLDELAGLPSRPPPKGGWPEVPAVLDKAGPVEMVEIAEALMMRVREIADEYAAEIDVEPTKLRPRVGPITEPPGPDNVFWWEVSVPAAAGPGGRGWMDANDGRRYRRLGLVRIVGGCMEPRIAAGSVVIVDPDTEWRPGDTVICRHDGEMLCKQVVERGGRLMLTAHDGTVIEPDESTQILGVVKWVPLGRK